MEKTTHDSMQAPVDKAKLYAAQKAAVELRAVFANLSPVERAAARMTKEYRAIEELVKAVEAL